jgi:hypothetical protein
MAKAGRARVRLAETESESIRESLLVELRMLILTAEGAR